MLIGDKLNFLLKLQFANELAELPLDELINQINTNLLPIVIRFNDFHYWIPVLNKFDEILESQIKKYQLSEPCTKLLEISSKDEHVIVSVLKFTEILINQCSTKSLYNSSDRLYDLLNSSNIVIRYHTLRNLTLIANRIVKKRVIRYAVPPIVKKKVSFLANCFPPDLQITDAKSINDSFDLLDVLLNEKPIPSKWCQLDFKYFKSTLSADPKSLSTDTQIATKNNNQTKSSKQDTISKKLKTGKKKSQKNSSTVEGVSHFVLSQDEIRKLSFQQIYDKACSVLPAEFWFKFGIQLAIAKSFSNKSFECLHLREQLVQLKIVATSFNLLINDSVSISDEQQISEADTQSIDSIITLIKPENQPRIPSNIYCDAMFSLAYICGKKYLRSELLKLMSGNVSHGLIFKILRSIYKVLQKNNNIISVRELSLQDNRSEDIKRSFTYFFLILENLVEMKQSANSLVSAGLLNQLLEFLPLRSNKYKNILAYSTYILKIVVTSNLNNLDPFISKDGFTLLIDAIGDQVDYTLKNQNMFSGLDVINDRTEKFDIKKLDENDLSVKILMKEREINYAKSLIKFSFDLIKTDSGDRMRNLFDSPLLQSLNKILINNKIFGPKVLTHALSAITSIIHNEPTSFPILVESNTIDTVISHFADFLVDDGYLILSLPDVIGAICLNKTGLQKIQDSKVITMFFDIFLDTKIARVLVQDELSPSLATVFDELGRHYSDLKPEILSATKALVEKVPAFVSSKMKGVQFYKSLTNKNLYYSESEPTDYEEKGFKTMNDDIEEEMNVLENAANFIYVALTDNEVWGPIFADVEAGTYPFDKWLPLLLYDKAPYDYLSSNCYFAIFTAVKSLEDRKNGYGFKPLFNEVLRLMKDPLIQDFANHQSRDHESFFARFDNNNTNDNSGSEFMRKLNHLCIGLNSFAEMFMQPDGANQKSAKMISQEFSTDEGLEFIGLMMKLFERIAVEEIVIRERLPVQVAQLSLPTNQSMFSSQLVLKSPVYNSELSNKIVKTSPKIKNTLQIRCIMEDIQSSVACCLSMLTRIQIAFESIMLETSPDPVIQLKQSAIFTKHIASLFVSRNFALSELQLSLTPSQIKNYFLVNLELLRHVMTREAYGFEHVQISFITYFMELDGLLLLKKTLLELLHDVKSLSLEDAQTYLERLNYVNVQQNDYCITFATIHKLLYIFTRICSNNLLKELPFLYSFQDRNMDPKSIKKAFLVQSRIFCFGVLVDVFETEVFDLESKKIPNQICSQLITIAEKVYSDAGENDLKDKDSVLYPLSKENLDRKEEQVKYLESLGLSDEESHKFLDKLKTNRLSFSSSSFAQLKDPEITEPLKWEDVKKKVFEKEFSPVEPVPIKPQFRNYGVLSNLVLLRTSDDNLCFSNLLLLPQLYSTIVPGVSSLLSTISESSYVEDPLSPWNDACEILYSFQKVSSAGSEDDTRFRAILEVIGTSLGYHNNNDRKPDVMKVLEFLDEFMSEDSVNFKWFSGFLLIYEKVLTSRLSPTYKEASCIVIPEYLGIPKFDRQYEISEVLYKKFLNIILSTKEFNDVNAACLTAKILILYLQDYENFSSVLDSGIISPLLKASEKFGDFEETVLDDSEESDEEKKRHRSLISKKKDEIDHYKSVLTALLRRCFETKEVVRLVIDKLLDDNIAAEATKDRYRGSRNHFSLKTLVLNSLSLVLRNPEAFVENVSSKVLLQDPQNPIQSLNVMKVPEKDDKNKDKESDKESGDAEDASMIDVSIGENMESSNTVEGKKEHSFSEKSSGVMRLLLSELMSIRPNEWAKDTAEQAKLYEELKEKPKKEAKSKSHLFKNPKHSYVCFLLSVIIELLASYKQCKLEFLTFSKKALTQNGSLKPRSTALNFFLHQLVPTNAFIDNKNNEFDRRSTVSRLAKLAVFFLLSTIDVAAANDKLSKAPPKEDSDMLFIRKFSIDIISKALKESCEVNDLANVRYSKVVDLAELCSLLIEPEFKSKPSIVDLSATSNDSFFIGKAMIERSIPSQMASILMSIDLNFPGVQKVSKHVVKFLNVIGSLKSKRQDLFKNCSDGEEEEEVDAEDYDSHDEITQLFRNSSLGMYDVDDYNSDDESDEFDDEDSDIIIYSDEIEDELNDTGEDEYGSDRGSVMEMDIDIDDEDGPDEDFYNNEEVTTVSLDDSQNDSENDADDDYDSENDNDDIEIIDEMHDDDDDNIDDYSDDYLSDEDAESEEDDDDVADDDEALSSDDSEIIDQWVEDYENDENRDHNRDTALRRRDIRQSFSADTGRMSFLRFLNSFSSNLAGGRERPFFDVVEDNSDDNDDIIDEPPLIGGRNHRDDLLLDHIELELPGARMGVVHGSNPGVVHHMDRDLRHGEFGRGGVGRLLPDAINLNTQTVIPEILGGRYRPRHFNRRAEKEVKSEFKSTEETWRNLYNVHFGRSLTTDAVQVIPSILDLIYEHSVKIEEKRKEEKRNKEKEAEEKRKREEEKRRKEEEDERRRREEEAAARGESNALTEENNEPIMVEIGGEEVDIAGTDIDLEFLLALPADMREEVYHQHMAEQRAQAARSSGSLHDIDPDFLDALPDQLRQEILEQQASSRQGRGIDILSHSRIEDQEGNDEEEEAEEESDEVGEDDKEVSRKRIYFTPLVEKGGVAGLLRLIFVKQRAVQRDHFYNLLEYLCYSKQTRSEVISILLYILQDGINDQKSLERAFVRLSNRAISLNSINKPLNNDSNANTSIVSAPSPSIPKNSLASQLPINASPVDVAARILGALNYLLDSYPHLRYYFLTEHESSISLKKLSRSKSRSRDQFSNKDLKYPINTLLSLIDKPLIKREQVLIDLLSKAIKTSTSSLTVIEKAKAKEKEKLEKTNDDEITDVNGKDKSKSLQSKKYKEESKKTSKQFELPSIPNSNLSLVVSILIADDCSSKTFQQALTTMRNFSSLSNSKQVFSAELSSFATNAGKLLVTDLKELAEVIAKSSDSTDINGFVLEKFTSSSSTQNKLLRVLTALDYLFDTENENMDFQSLKSLYEKLALGPLWGTLSDCLRGLEKNKSLYNVATVLLPLIESLMVVCKHSKVKDLQVKDTLRYESKAHDFAKEPIESLFFSFTNEHKTILNEMVRTKPKLMSGPFSMLVRNPKILEFDNKKNYFDRKLHNNATSRSTLPIKVSRDRVFLDTYRACAFKPADVFRDSKLDITFKGEAGVDAGGVTREWYQVLSRQIFNPDYALFIPVASDRSTFHPNRTSGVNSEHLLFFKFIGRIIGKAIYDSQYLDAHFSRAVYKRLLGRSVSLKDMETLDLDYFKSLMWMLENDITDIITETFSVETDDYGEHKVIDLKPDGSNIPVTEENKQEYVKLVVEYKLQESVKEQMDNFLQGFHEIIPKDLIAIFDEQELELLISGLPDIDVDDWKNNSVYTNYSPSNTVIQWFWRAVKSFDKEQKAKLLQFVTGTSKVPLTGFAALAGVNGNHKFSIHRDYGSLERLPSAHTCFNQLDLPPYESYEQLRGSLLLAITEGHEGFGFA